ncbi:MAG: hypothetical protein H0U74_19530 [Bradymonadaceae bacterium]|nr:hypothetical protein [Lujinxingiaceae bacterium]
MTVTESLIVRVPSFAALALPEDAVVVADAGLPRAWLEALGDPILVEAGESLKRLASIEQLAEQVLARRSTRPLTLVAVGGGSVGDAVGFLASVLWRGVELWHVPTTLLAMVDSAHGGKTAVNLGHAKNQLGTFYSASRVVLVDQALATLPLEQRRDGLAELVKGLWLGDADALAMLDAEGGVDALAAAPFEVAGERLMALLQRAIDVKLAIVERDMFETKGIRTFLNFGHTVGHTVELLTGVSHGQAVCWGLLSASFLSGAHMGLDVQQTARLRRHVYALLTPAQAIASLTDRERFAAGIARDKKRINADLRSICLRAPGEPFVTREVSPEDWFEAFREAVEWFESTPALVERRANHVASLSIAASKSEMNRALVIEHLRPGQTAIEGHSTADDVVWLKSCLKALRENDGPAQIYCGEGGTTFRFLVAVSAARAGETLLLASARLLERPHTPLYDALRAAGASIEPVVVDGVPGVRVVGWASWPERVEVSAAGSSQYPTALALLAASGASFVLALGGTGEMASEPYFEMTLDLLRRAGVNVQREDGGWRFGPTPQLSTACTLSAEADASSAAVWAMGRLVGVEAAIARAPVLGRQPDARAASLAASLGQADRDGLERLVIELSEAPDLAPVLVAVASQLDCALEIVGAAHLRHKESDRIGDLVTAFERVGVRIEAREDGIFVPPGRQRAQDGALFETFGDHRLAMAGLLMSASGASLLIERPMVVAKSYPDFWHHVRSLGWSVVPR